jgi:hypothetical protein
MPYSCYTSSGSAQGSITLTVRPQRCSFLIMYITLLFRTSGQFSLELMPNSPLRGLRHVNAVFQHEANNIARSLTIYVVLDRARPERVTCGRSPNSWSSWVR